MRLARRVDCTRNLQEFSTKKLSSYPCGQVVSKFTLQVHGETRLHGDAQTKLRSANFDCNLY